MKFMFERLIKLKNEAEAIRTDLDAAVPDGDIISSGMFSLQVQIDGVIGALVASEYSNGRITIEEVKP
jgi:hypothetical protein